MVEDAGKGLPQARLDSLTDGVFAFAMTLLVLNLQFPGDLRVSTPDALLETLSNQSGPFIAYVISFFVLAIRWLAVASARQAGARCSFRYAWTVLVHLFLVTLIPFSTMLVGSYGDMWPAVCVYAANTSLAAVASMLAASLLEQEQGRGPDRDAELGLIVLILSAILSVILGFWAPSAAMFAYLLNAATPVFARIRR